VLLESGYGYANAETKQANGVDTRFNLASLGKLLTRLAILQLAQSGQIDMAAPVGKYLPDFPNPDVRDRVTIQHLVDMRSGVGSYWNDAFAARRSSVRTTDDYLALFATDKLAFEPGSQELYSNGGYIILGKIIEVVSGLSYPDYVKSRIAVPAQMEDLEFLAVDEKAERVAIGYTTQTPSPVSGATNRAGGPAAARVGHMRSTTAATLQPNTPLLPGRGQGAGGGYASVRDFLRLDSAIRGNKLLDATWTARFLGDNYAKGGLMGFSGGYPGANTMFLMFADGTSIIAFANLDPPAASGILSGISERLGKRRLRTPG
jgi:D-alanyl-D-alanine carboxypeptidase